MIDVPLYMQGVDTAWCVPYSIQGVAEYYGLYYSRNQVIDAVKAHKTTGTYMEDFTDGVKELGLKFERLKFNYTEVQKSLNAGIPVAISYQNGKKESHFTVIIDAYKDYRGTEFYTLNDTYYGRINMPVEVIEVLVRKDVNFVYKSRSWAR